MTDHSKSPTPVSLLTLLRTPSPPSAKSYPQPILRRDSLSSDCGPDSTLIIKHDVEPRKALKFAVAPHPTHPHPPLRIPSPLEDSDESDRGYQEDEEDGICSDDEVFGATIPPPPQRYPFARPTGYASPSAPSAPAVLPPPPRRGRGHIKVIDTNETPKKCSRHCSPPPARSRSGSDARSRTSDAGPRDGRCGSPMPDVSDLEDEEGTSGSSEGMNVRYRWRRASDHLPAQSRTCPPTVVNERVLAGSLSRQEDSVYQRLESSLTSKSAMLTRARSMGSAR